MKLPNGDRAVIPPDKLSGYLLNDAHIAQPGHAELFRRLLGIGPKNADVLRAALLKAAATEDAVSGSSSTENRFPGW